jgi:folate-binding protein YgfZ
VSADHNAEYEALRHGVGAFALARDVVAASGPDAVAYLQGQCSQDLAGLELGAAADSLVLQPDGKLVALVRVVRVAEDRFLLDVDGGFGEALLARLRRFLLRSKLVLELLAWRCVALRGPEVAALALPEAEPGRGEGLSVPFRAPAYDGRVSAFGGVDLLGPDPSAQVPSEVRWCSAAAWEACRVEAGIPAMGRELDERTIPAEAGLVARTVSFTKGCYTGQELVSRLDARGSRVARRLWGLVAPDGSPQDLAGAVLSAPGRDKPVGSCTSAAYAFGLEAAAGLGYLHRSVEAAGTMLTTDGGLRVEARALPLC